MEVSTEGSHPAPIMKTPTIERIAAAVHPTLYDGIEMEEANVYHYIDRRGCPTYSMDIHVLMAGRGIEFASRFIEYPCIVVLEQCPDNEAIAITLAMEDGYVQTLTNHQDCAFLPGSSGEIAFTIEASVCCLIRLLFLPEQCNPSPPSANSFMS